MDKINSLQSPTTQASLHTTETMPQLFARKMSRVLTAEELEWVGGAAKAKPKLNAGTPISSGPTSSTGTDA